MVADDVQGGANDGTEVDHEMVRRSPGILTSVVRPDEELAMAIDGDVVELRGTALELWRLIQGKVRIDALIQQLADRYDVEPRAITSDVVAAVERLLAEGLLERVRT